MSRATSTSVFLRVLIFGFGFMLLETGVGLIHGVQVSLADASWLAWVFVGGLLIALLLAWTLPKTRLKRVHLIVLVWFVLFVVENFNNMLEGYFFTSQISSISVFIGGVFLSLLTTLVEGALAGALFLPPVHDRGLGSELSGYFKERSSASWVWRIVLGSVAYFPVYFLFGALISPFVVPYYSNTSLGLRIPSFTVMIPLEFFRGFLYVVSLLAVFAALAASRRTLFAIIVSVLYVPGGLVPLIANRSLPPEIVPFHLLEIFADSLVYGAILTRLFARRPS